MKLRTQKNKTMKNINTVILSENIQKISKLRDLLSRYYTLDISHVCSNSASAIEYLNRGNPTILFMDITFTNVLKDVKKPPFIVGLCDTIYTKKIKHFLKMGFFEIFYAPYEEMELNSIMGKILNIYCSYNKEQPLSSYVREYDITYNNYMNKTDSLFIMGTRNEESSRIYFNDVLYLSKVGNYVCVNFTDGSKKYYRSNLKLFHKRFPSSKFVKINRSTVVNIEKVIKIVKSKVILVNNEEFEVSRSFKKQFKAFITGYPSQT